MPTDKDPVEFRLPIIKNPWHQKLKIIRLKKTLNGDSSEFGSAFRRYGPIPTIAPPGSVDECAATYLQANKVSLNWYPKIRAIKSGDAVDETGNMVLNEAHLTDRHVAFMDFDHIWFELERFKSERGWHNLNMPKREIGGLLSDSSWYCLQIPEEELVGDSYDKVYLWEEIAIALLKKYIGRYYTFRKREWELPRLEYRDLESDDPNFLCAREPSAGGYYRILVDKSQEEIVAKLEELKSHIQQDKLTDWRFQGIHAISFSRHLYQPLLYLEKKYLEAKVIEISPVPLNEGERQFVEDLKVFCDENPDFFKSRELYLLRNQSRGHGVGFFEAGNFYPDFILWLVSGSKQHIIFVDPKGLRYLKSDDPKIQFYKIIKGIEKRLDNPAIHLNSFIISKTSSAEMCVLWQMQKHEMQNRHILFQEEDRENYIETVLRVSP